jgi:hypothetical protein
MSWVRRLVERTWVAILVGRLERDLATADCNHETVNVLCRVCVLLAMAGGVVPQQHFATDPPQG